MNSADAGNAGPANVRDLGGLPTLHGGRTRRGVFFRGDAPYYGDHDVAGMAAPSDVVDLRSDLESQGGGPRSYSWPNATVIHKQPLLTEAAPELQHRPLADLYRTMLDSAGQQIAQVAHVVARAEGQVFVHCAMGKDRTGVAVAVILLAVGTEPGAVIADYLATGAKVDAVLARMTALHDGDFDYHALPPHILQTDQRAIEAVIDELGAAPGGPRGWLHARGVSADDLSLLRRKLTVPGTV